MSLPDRPQGNAFNDPFNGPEARRRSTKDKRPSVFSSSDSDVGAADDVLGALGYDQELSRNRSTLQVAFMSFVLASIPYGLSTTFTYPLAGGGPANIVWGWFMVSLIILCVAISLGEITSVYPTSGGVYFQTYMLSPARYKRILAWFCGWAFTVGNITITLSVNFGSALFFVACVNIFESSPGVPIWDAETYQIFLVFLAITIFCNAVSAFGNKWLPVLDTFAIFWTLVGVVALVVCVLVLARGGRRSADFVFTEVRPQSGWPSTGWSFMVGLLQAAFATSSTGMILSMCEEVRQPTTQVPKAMVGTIVLNFCAGWLFLIPLVFVFPDLTELVNLADGQPVPPVVKSAVGNDAGAFALLIPIMVLALLCGTACTTAASRCTWAFARDGAIPGHIWWRKVNKRLNMPLNAMLLSMIVQIVLGLIYFGSTAAFNAFSGVGVICLTVSYAMPIAVNFATGRKSIERAPFHMGVFGAIANVVAISWSLLAIPLFSMPSALPVQADTMNYASVVFVAFIAVATLWYLVWGMKNYEGPPTSEGDAERARQMSVVSQERRRSSAKL